MSNRFAFMTLLAGAASLAGQPAEARLMCKDGFQVVQGNLIATPYCQDDQLATVARGYGYKVSAAAIRHNPNLKRDVCRFVGRDIRVYQHCTDANVNGRRGY